MRLPETTAANDDARDRLPKPTGLFLYPGGGEIGGMNLSPELYGFSAAATINSGALTLTGGPNDVRIFQTGTTLNLSARDVDGGEDEFASNASIEVPPGDLRK